jgi:hypothetical protein
MALDISVHGRLGLIMHSLVRPFQISTAELVFTSVDGCADAVPTPSPRVFLRDGSAVRRERNVENRSRIIQRRLRKLRAQFQSLAQELRAAEAGAHGKGHARRECPADDQSGQFDVMISYNRENFEEVSGIVRELERLGVHPWFDYDWVYPGDPVFQMLDAVVCQVASAVVFLGDEGLGAFQARELHMLNAQHFARNCRIIPVILASATRTPEFPASLATRSWLDFRHASADAIHRLCLAITGKRPGPRQRAQG